MIIYDIRRLSYFNYFPTDGKEIIKIIILLSTQARKALAAEDTLTFDKLNTLLTKPYTDVVPE